MPAPEELRSLLQFLSENLSIEYKSWLDLAQNHGKANLAKAAIALANHGGGIIVLGMREDTAEGAALRSLPRPAELGRYSQDEINAAIARYSDPAFHCSLMFESHPDSGHEHAFVIVPGEMVPVMCRRTCEGVISQHRCYVRKPGPRSEEPLTAEEWRGLLQRCVLAERENMLNAIRLIVHGHASPAPTETVCNALETFGAEARARWHQLTAELPLDHNARMPNGHYEIEFEFIGVRSAGSLTETLQRMTEAGRVKHTGWTPFVLFPPGHPLGPIVSGDSVEGWVGRPHDEFIRDPAQSNFWRAHPSGLLFLLRGYDEDSLDNVEPATALDITTPIWRIGEAMLYASRLARLFDTGDPDVLVRCRYCGLRGRKLGGFFGARRFIPPTYICNDDNAELQTQATANQMDDNLVEVLHSLLVPLYERFAFFELPRELVRAEIEQMRKTRF